MQPKKNDMGKQLEVAEVEAATVKNDLKLAMKRIEDLQTAITGGLGSESYSGPGSDSSDEDIAVSTRDLRRDVTLKREEEDESQA
jgi:myosin-18